jgi:anti-sigma factor (TIGR02949 family)
MISCEDAVERVYEYLDGELDPDWNERVREHLEVCKRCYPYFDFERIFLDHIRSKGLKAERSERLERKVRDMLRELD